MRRLATLCRDLDLRSDDAGRLAALRTYLAAVDDADAAWAVTLLAGGWRRRVVPAALLRRTACALADIDDVLFDACRQAAGSVAETVANVVPLPARPDAESLAHWMQQRVLPLCGMDTAAQGARVAQDLGALDAAQRRVYLRLISGNWRLTAHRPLLQQALAAHAGLDAALIAQRLEAWATVSAEPSASCYRQLLALQVDPEREAGHPYPFADTEQLADLPPGAPGDWLVTWHVDRPPVQVVKRRGRVWAWQPGNTLIAGTDLVAQAGHWPDGTVVEGDLTERAPRRLRAHDLLEHQGLDLRRLPLRTRRQRLQALMPASEVTPGVHEPDWPALAALCQQARQHGAAGLRLQRLDGVHGQSIRFWPAAPTTFLGVLIYAEPHPDGRCQGTVAVWQQVPPIASAQAIGAAPPLVPVAKVMLGSDEADRAALTELLRAHTVQRFGPIHSLRPTLVVEVAFDGALPSRRHKSGLTLRAPRFVRRHASLAIQEADTLARLRA